MKMASLFDGSGGFPLAALMHGITPLWASEIEPFPIRVTSRRFPQMKHYGDVSKINGAEVEPVDIITFGSPCQDLSIAGKRDGLEGSRSGLFYEAIRIIKEMRRATNGRYPRYAVWENVPGCFSSNRGEDFRAVLQAFADINGQGLDVPQPQRWEQAGEILGARWSLAWRLLDAKYLGVPQRRKRVFLVCSFANECAGEILFERKGVRRDSTESGEPRQEAAEDVRGCSSGAISFQERAGCAGGGKGILIQKDCVGTLSTLRT